MNENSRIILVDDDPRMLRTLSMILKSNGYQVIEAATGQECLQLVRADPPDLVLLDVLLPDLNGIEICRQIKADPALAHSMVVLISAQLTTSDNRAEGLEGMADDYISLPISKRELLSRVRTMLRLKRAEEALQERTEQLAERVNQLNCLYSISTLAEKALQESEAKNRAILDALPDLMFRFSRQGEILDFRANDPEDLVLDPNQVIGSNLADSIPPEVYAQFMERLGQTLDSGQMEIFEYRLPVKRGLQDFEARLVISGPDEVLAIVRNVTERKRAEQALQKSEARFKAVWEISADAMALSDPDGIVLAANPAYAELYGHPLERVIGHSFAIIFPEEQRAWAVEQYRATFANPKLPPVFESETRRADGTQRYVESRIGFITDNGIRVAMLSTIRDITERKEAEEQLKTALAEKETLLRELYHRTKNNMYVISSMLALQADYIRDEQARDIFRQMEDRIRSMALVHQKLYQSGNLSSIDLREYIEELADLLLQSYRVHPNRISLKCELESVTVLIDSAIPCGLIVNELISNALQHAFPGDMKGEVTIGLRKKGDTIHLWVADNGVGTPPEFNIRQTDSLGLRTVMALGEKQLKGEVKFTGAGGVTCQLDFQDTLYRARI